MYYSPILFSEIADLNLTPYHDCMIDMQYLNSKENIIIYCLHSMSYIEKMDFFLDEVKRPFIFITAMEDTQLPLEISPGFIEKIKYNSFFRHWFSINKTIPNDSYFTSIPYGLDYWTLTQRPYFGENKQTFAYQNSNLEIITNNMSDFSTRIPKIYGNFHLHQTDERHGGWRRKLLSLIPRDIIYYQPSIVSRSESFQKMANYSFVVSPFGHGFDCIRTFEALCLGCIVIMKKSFLDVIYEDLPVLLVDEWSDINDILLKKTLEEFKCRKFNYKKLKMEYWIDLVKSKI